MSVEKQVIINKIAIPYELLSIIKDYCFDNELSLFIKTTKKQIINDFKYAFSRINNFNYNFNKLEETWCFWFGSKNDIQYQAVNCRKCGNYKLSQNIELQEGIRCYC